MELDPKKFVRRIAAFWFDLARARWARFQSPELDDQVRSVLGGAVVSQLLLLLVVVTWVSTLAAANAEDWPEIPVLILSSPAIVFGALLGLRLRLSFKRLREITSAPLQIAFDAMLGLVMFTLIVASVLDTLMLWNERRVEGLTEWVQTIFLFGATDDLVMGPIEATTWTLMWACVVCAQFATRRNVADAAGELFGYGISLAVTFFLVKLIVIDLAISRMVLEFLLEALPLPEIVINEEWLARVEWLFFRVVMVTLELSIAASAWTSARDRFAGVDEKSVADEALGAVEDVVDEVAGEIFGRKRR